VVLYHHVYPLRCITLFLTLVLSAAVSLRGASRVLEVLGLTGHVPGPKPTWFAGRLWLLRLGYYQLTRPKVPATDWVWIIDHTIQLGPEKCLVILGLRLSQLPPGEACLQHTDVELLDLVPVQKSNGTIVYQQLEKVVAQTGVPREILSDHGSDLKVGTEQFCQHHPETCAVYDIKHKTAAVLKRELEPDAAWNEFLHLASQTKQQLQQTALASWAPPTQKVKARDLNVAPLVTWGQRILVCLDQSETDWPTSEPDRVHEKLDWVKRFRPTLAEWAELFAVSTTTESVVRHQGLRAETPAALEQRLHAVIHTERGQRIAQELLTFVTTQVAQARPQERLVGSSEIIESVLGKLKRIEQDQATGGFTGLVLSLGAMVSQTTEAVIQKALETVSSRDVWTWCHETLGTSVQAQRRQLMKLLKQAEQKQDQLSATA
jgi:hypothetical protein